MCNYLPVYIGDSIKYIYSSNAKFHVDMLRDAENLLNGNGSYMAKLDNNGNVIFDNIGVTWAVPKVALALRALNIAYETGFYYVPIFDKYNEPRLFISKKFDSHKRILVDAITLTSIVVEDKIIANRLMDLTYEKHPSSMLYDIYKATKDYITNKSVFLDALVVNRGGDSLSETPEYIALSPFLTKYYISIGTLSLDDIKELESATKGHSTESYYLENHMIRRNNLKYWRPVPKKYMLDIIKLVKSTYDGKSNYRQIICKDTYDALLYVSTDFRHLVKASTLEHVLVSNIGIINRLKEVCNRGNSSIAEVYDLWSLATECIYEVR